MGWFAGPVTVWSARMRTDRVTDPGRSGHFAAAGAVCAAEDVALHFHAVPEHAALAVFAHRGEPVRRALEGVEHMRLTAHRVHLEGHPIVIAADLTYSHVGSPSARHETSSLRSQTLT